MECCTILTEFTYSAALKVSNNGANAQAVRNLDDLECLACPPKYRELKSFYKYYTGELTAPYLTLFSKTHSLPTLDMFPLRRIPVPLIVAQQHIRTYVFPSKRSQVPTVSRFFNTSSNIINVSLHTID